MVRAGNDKAPRCPALFIEVKAEEHATTRECPHSLFIYVIDDSL
jgi:hypothetical protein